MKICARCDKAIQKGQQYVTRDIETASGPGAVIHLHAWCQRDAVTQPLRYPAH
jgi:hypothetical protein